MQISITAWIVFAVAIGVLLAIDLLSHRGRKGQSAKAATIWTFVWIAIGYLILRIGLAVLRMFAQPVAEPPPPGELRRVKLNYRCDICGTEVRMTFAYTRDSDPAESNPVTGTVGIDGRWDPDAPSQGAPAGG